MDCSLPGSSVHRILQARIQEWVAISISRDLPNPGMDPGLPHCRQTLYHLSHILLINNMISGTQSHSDPITYYLLDSFPLIYFCNAIYFALPSLPLIYFWLPVISPWLILTSWKTSQIWSQIPSNYTLHLYSWKGWRKTQYHNISSHFRTLAGNMQCSYNAL